MPHGTRGCGIPQCNGRYTLPSASGIPALICRRCSALHWSSCRPADSRGGQEDIQLPAVSFLRHIQQWQNVFFHSFKRKVFKILIRLFPVCFVMRQGKIAAVYRNPDTIGLCFGICRCSACSCCFICSALSTSGQPGYCHGYRKYGR